MPSCIVLFKNGQKQCIEIPERFDRYEWEEDDGFFVLYGLEIKRDEDIRTKIAKIRLKSINGYYFNHDY